MSKLLLGLAGRTPARSGRVGRHQLLFHEQDNGGGQQGGSQQGGQGDGQQNLQGLLQRHNNDAMAVIATLLAENHGLRDRNRQLRDQAPGQGAVVLSGADATTWQAYQALGAPDVLKTALTERDTAQRELGESRRRDQIREVAEVAKYKASVLADRAKDLELEIAEVEENGVKEKRAFVKAKDGQKTRLEDYAKTHWPDYLPALQADQQQNQQPTGTKHPRQSAGGAPTNTDPVKTFVSSNYTPPKLRGQQ